MEIQRHGIILNVEHFDECVAFYRDLFGLPVLFSKIEGDFKLTCLEYGATYLMIETEGVSNTAGKSISENATKLRFNVADIQSALHAVRDYGIDAQIVENAWGVVINITDPDGNRVGIRDELGFKQLIF
ncbi:VOC family protein [Moritella dasanensis]|uniref:VOC family protein n=1 Tax=Moritella dasanensis TaxID=428031 RepID=UPI0003121ADF|nr:VOC family protein [Moritella dasanensis]